MKGMGHIVWYADIDKLDFNNPWTERWWIKQVLVHGRLEDINKLNLETVKRLLPTLKIQKKIKSLWEDYFESRKI